MKKILFILAMLIMSLGVKAQQGWRYQDNCALLESDWDYLSGDVESPTALSVYIRDGFVYCFLSGECTIHSFRKNQKYIMVSFGIEEEQRWAITEKRFQGSDYRAFSIDNASKFIEKLREAETFYITMPLYQYGIHTFYFYTNGYPLDM